MKKEKTKKSEDKKEPKIKVYEMPNGTKVRTKLS
jgi:hypothetical protein